LQVKRRNLQAIATPGYGFSSAPGCRAKIGWVFFVGPFIYASYPLDAHMQKSASEPVAEPILHCDNRLYQVIGKHFAKTLSITVRDTEINISRYDRYAAHCESGAANKPPIKLRAFLTLQS
jgi:hypothetical protein